MVPVLLFAYNRPKHFAETLNALAANKSAEQTDLYVFCDGSKSESDRISVDEVHRIADNIIGFASVTKVYRDQNMGLAGNIISGVTQLFETFDRLIILEDDLITSPGFLHYMNQALEFYKNTTVFSVCGYTPAIKIPNEYAFSTYLTGRIGSWGWGTWKSRWKQVDWHVSDYEQFISSRQQRMAFEKDGNDLSMMLFKQQNGKNHSWAIRFSYACYKQLGEVVYPVQTLVINQGVDGSGTNMKATFKYANSMVSGVDSQLFAPAGMLDKAIRTKFRRFYNTRWYRTIYNRLILSWVNFKLLIAIKI